MRSALVLLSMCGFAMSSNAGGLEASERSLESAWENEAVEILEADYRQIGFDIDSGGVVGAEILGGIEGQAMGRLHGAQEPVWSTVVRVEDADWLRLEFGDVDLSSATGDARESYLRVTSLLDGHEQYLDYEALQVWGNTTAYFNGNAVRVEIMASAGSVSADRVQISGVQASAPVASASICFSVDDRVLSSDPRDARLMPIGCSAWMFSQHGNTFLTAGHCSPSGGNVVQFNVPLSSSGGGYRNPPPQDQYVVDGASVQTQAGGPTLGNDWGFFGAFDNSGTGLSPLAAQGDAHTLASSTISNDGRPIRITGYGTTSSPVSPTWNGVQKTHVGPFQGYSGNVVRYTTDTTGGNSGSVILDDNNNQAIGIHTNAGCGSGGGWNHGCNLFNSGLQTALANPTGIAAPRTIQGDVSAAPDFVSPDGGEAVQLVISNFHGRTIVGSPVMFVDNGSGFAALPTSMIDASTFEGVLPATDCGGELSYYFQISDTDGNTTEYPEGGESAALRTIALDGLVVHVTDDFQTDTGWVVQSTGVSDGPWERQSPISSTANGGAPNDADGSGICYVTGRGVVEDLDGGPARILSPFADTSVMEEPTVSFWAWVHTADSERMIVEFSPNLGIQWFPVDEIDDTNGWEMKRYLVSDFVELSPLFTMRITMTDEGGDSLVEGGIDGFSISTMVCNGGDCAADFTGDGALDFFDISAFLTAFGDLDPSADFTGDGSFDFFDISAFLTAFDAGCP